MSEYINELSSKFIEIKNMGWIKAHRTGDTAIGKTFEDLLGKEEDNKSLPDYKDIEIKSQDKETSSMLSLFSLSPKPACINTKLRESYGVADEENPELKILNTTISATAFNTHRGGFDFKLEIDEENKKLYIVIKNHNTNEIVSKEPYWDFSVLQDSLNKKLKYIAYVSADKKIENGETFFKYSELFLITGLSLENFLKGISDGKIKADIRIGVNRTKGRKNYGTTHDHGTGFRIIFSDLKEYADIKRIN